jgi:Bacterial archaeo-eukaryotic release factor family 10
MRGCGKNGTEPIILAGSPEITAELRAILPKRLQSKVIGTVDLATAATIEEIATEAGHSRDSGAGLFAET